ncbi:P1 family peptidase, partial [Variovorax sp. Varisp62]|uniref:P1 family peptidase n=1 Tax=Variovorax sp. Varisp62 TaxID=3243049 RepID=UPI0039B4385F
MPSITLPYIGNLLQGARNAITDVEGVTVGHQTLDDGGVQTGVTVVRPHAGDPFRDKVPAAAVVLNGFGKSVGLVQLAELGVLETPIALTNTFSVGTVATAQIRHCVAANPESGRSLPTVNPLVFECNDGFLNDIQRLAVTEADYLRALDGAGADFAQGSVGAGRGMSSFQFKGGIGSASRRVSALDGDVHTVGALVLANYGRQPQLVLA